jgi:hypothetical protein
MNTEKMTYTKPILTNLNVAETHETAKGSQQKEKVGGTRNNTAS